MSLPPGLEPVEGARGWGFASSEARAWVAEALERGEMLRSRAAGNPEALALAGRGPVHAVPAPGGGRWVVRPYRRGGAVAGPLLGDRHLRIGVPRPLAEARASAEARRRGVPTPRVIGGAVYPTGAFYRADLVTEYIPASRDLAAWLLAGDAAPQERALEEAGRLIARMSAAGLEHPDLNARNILLVQDGATLRAVLLDLDRCRLRPGGGVAPAGPPLARLERSLRKIARGAGVTLPVDEWTHLLRAAAGV